MADVPSDDELMAALRDATHVPPGWIEQAKALFTWRTIDEELASLTYDSSADASSAAVRSGDDGPSRRLDYSGPNGSLSVDHFRDERLVVGHTDVEGELVEVETQDGVLSALPLVDGEFEFSPPDVRCRLAVVAGGRRVLVTEWERYD